MGGIIFPLENKLNSRKAFTLIELLVVIAIIAILAAILFPVFAQAKVAAKKAAALTQSKQVGTAIQIYIADYDDVFPLDGIGAPGGLINTGTVAPFPAGWHTAFEASQWASQYSASHWGNSTQPYIKNIQLLDVQGTRNFDSWNPPTLFTDGPPNKVKEAGRMTTYYNGYLHSWSATAVESPSGLTMLWYGMGSQSARGAALSQPLLQCFSVPSCRYTPGGVPSTGAGTNQTYMWGPRYTMDVFNGGANFVAADTSARYRPLGIKRTVTAGGDWKKDPFALYNTDGSARTPWVRTTNGVTYILHFMPDAEF